MGLRSAWGAPQVAKPTGPVTSVTAVNRGSLKHATSMEGRCGDWVTQQSCSERLGAPPPLYTQTRAKMLVVV